MGAISSPGGIWDSVPAFLIFLAIVSITIAIVYIRVSRKQRKLTSTNLGKSQQIPDGAFSLPVPKSRTLFGLRSAVGVIIGLVIIGLDLLLFTDVVPVRTTTQFIESVGLLILGILVAGFSSIYGLSRVSNAGRQERERS